MALADRLRDRIGREGPLAWPAWMEACLYDASDGYYARPGRKTGAGDDADFATNPTLHPFFARCIAQEVAARWHALGSPDGFDVWEFGGGEGDLARDALRHLDDAHPDLAGVLRWHHVERSAVHRAAQAARADDRVDWADDLPDGAVGVVVAHEFLDALPFWWLERVRDGWAGLHVGHDGDEFTLQRGPCPPDVATLAPERVPTGHRVAVMHQARDWLHRIAARLRSGAVLVVDYGGDAVWRRDRDGTVRTFAHHQDAGEAWLDPGDKDVTASVDFAALRGWARDAGLRLAWEESQEAFLVRHGALEHLNRIGRDSVEGASDYLRLRQMVLPTGMGQAFRVACWKV